MSNDDFYIDDDFDFDFEPTPEQTITLSDGSVHYYTPIQINTHRTSLLDTPSKKAVRSAVLTAKNVKPMHFHPDDVQHGKAEAENMSSDVANNPNFRQWFGNSVTHTDGQPHVFYHGTSKDKHFTSFNAGRHGIWLTRDPEEAAQYARQNDSQGYKQEGWKMVPTNTDSRVLPVYAKAENPYTGEYSGALSDNYKKAQSDWFDTLRAKGHDAWIPASGKGNLAVMLKEPQQIKSVHNAGTFDPNKKDMGKAGGGAVGYSTGGSPKPGDTKSENIADYVADLLRQGRASEVTDDLMAQADPQRLHQHYTSGNTGQSMPMDYASRMERAKGMGFDTSLYHGGNRDILGLNKFDGLAEGGPGAFYSTDDPQVANTYANKQAGVSGQNVTPLLAKTKGYIEKGFTKPFPENGTDAEQMSWVNENEKWNRSLDYSKKPYFENVVASARARNAPGAVIRQVEDNKTSGRFDTPSDVHVTLDPTNIRSQFARFDPRLGHLAHLSASTGGAMDLARAVMAKDRAGGQIAPSKYMPGVPRQVHKDGGRIGKAGGGSMDLRSKAAQVVRDQPQAKGNVDQLLAMMAARGVKPSELLNAGRPFGHSVSKEELAQHFENSVPDVQVQRNDGLRAGSRPTRYNNYTLPGGEKYREHLLHLGDIEDQKQKLKESLHEQWEKAKAAGDTETADQIVSKYYSLGNYDVDPNFQSNHWTIPNVLAHVRMKDRDNGKTLHVEEVQSDWGQKGREKGFYDPAKPIEVFHTGTGKTVHATHDLGEAKRKAEELGPEYDYAYQDKDKVPQGPYVGNTQQWTDLALKHALSEAARGGHDRVVFSPGEANANLYGIDPKGMSEYYKNFVHKGATKLMQQHDPSIQPESYDLPGGYKGYSLPMTDTARQSILKNGFQAFKDGGTVEEPITAYHGSPHSFDKFDISKIGTGEGAQSYGHGLYFAGNENIAKGYRDALTDPENVPLHFDQRPVDTPWNEDIRARWPEHFAGKSQRDQDALEEALGNLSQVNQMADVPNALNNMSPAAKYMYQRHIRPKLNKPDLGKGHMYKVKLNVKPHELLDWDRPIADQHPNVRNAVQQALFDKYGQNANIENRRGSDLTHLLQEPDFISRLRDYGIKGIRYLDAGSRDAGEGTHNYVMFHHEPVEVTEKYAYGGKVDVGRALDLTRRFTKDGTGATMALKSKGN